MGRYYSSASGDISGKFGFGVQSSDAGRRFGMVENQNCITLYTDDDEKALAEINKIFDEMGVPEKDRKTDFSESDDFCSAIREWSLEIDLWGYAVEEVPEKDFKGGVRYHSEKEGYVGQVKDHKMLENYFDLLLGIEIYNDILRNDYCELECEL